MPLLALHVLTPNGWHPIPRRRTRDDLRAVKGIAGGVGLCVVFWIVFVAEIVCR